MDADYVYGLWLALMFASLGFCHCGLMNALRKNQKLYDIAMQMLDEMGQLERQNYILRRQLAANGIMPITGDEPQSAEREPVARH